MSDNADNGEQAAILSFVQRSFVLAASIEASSNVNEGVIQAPHRWLQARGIELLQARGQPDAAQALQDGGFTALGTIPEMEELIARPVEAQADVEDATEAFIRRAFFYAEVLEFSEAVTPWADLWFRNLKQGGIWLLNSLLLYGATAQLREHGFGAANKALAPLYEYAAPADYS